MGNEETLNDIEQQNNEVATTEDVKTTAPVDGELPKEHNDGNVSAVDDDKATEDRSEDSAKKDNADTVKRTAKNNKAKTGEKPRGMSKTFKLVYYPVLAMIAIVMLVFSVIDGVYGYKPKAYGNEYFEKVDSHIERLASDVRSSMAQGGISSARDYITDTLKDGGFNLQTEVKEGEDSDDGIVTTETDWYEIGDTPAPTVTVMTSKITTELQNKMDSDGYLVGMQITDVIAAVPSLKTRQGEESKAVVITVGFDSRTDTYGAADNAAFVAVAMQSLIEIVRSDVNLNNDLIVVFTEDLDRSFGAYSFFESFKGLDDVVARAEYGINLDAFGNAGTLAITDASGADLKYFNACTKISGSAFNSSLTSDALDKNIKTTGAVAAFGDIPAIQVAVVGGLDAAQSSLDTADNLSPSVLHQQARFFKDYVDAFANTDKSYNTENNNDLVFFSYLDMGTVAYDSIASYVIGAIIVALLAAVITVVAVKKTFNLKKMFAALGMQLLVAVSSLAAMFAAYFLITLMLTGFGVLPIHSIVQIRYFNAGIFIAAMFVALASAFGFTTVYKKLFKVTSSDAVRGTALEWGIVGAVMSFAVPAYSYVTVWLGLLLLAVLLVTACLNGKLKSKFGFGFDRLFVFTVPVILCMPLTFAAMSMLTTVIPLYLLPVTMLMFVAMLGTAVPYLDRSAVVFDKVAKKLPMRTVRVQRVVTEKVEDRAKKGKFTERTVKRIDKEKVYVNYKNYFGVSVIALVGCVIALFAGGFGVSFGKSITSAYAYNDAVYNDSLVYEWVKKSDGSITQKIVVDDLMAYKYFRNAVSGLKWNAEETRYEMNANYNASDIINSEPSIKRADDVYTVNTFEGSLSTITLTIPSASSVTKITVTNSHDVSYEYNFNKQSTIVLRLPYGFGNTFTLKFEGATPATIVYEERRIVTADSKNNNLTNVDEWNKVLQYYNGMDIVESLRGGIVLRLTASGL